MVNNIIVGKRIPVGAAVGGLCTFLFSIWNMVNPEYAFSVAQVGAFSTALIAVVQMVVVNLSGVTTK